MKSTPHEGYRRTLRVRTAEDDAVTLIVTLQRGHRHGRVWLSLGSTTQTTVTLSGAQVGELTGALPTAAGNGGGATPSEAAVGATRSILTRQYRLANEPGRPGGVTSVRRHRGRRGRRIPRVSVEYRRVQARQGHDPAPPLLHPGSSVLAWLARRDSGSSCRRRQFA